VTACVSTTPATSVERPFHTYSYLEEMRQRVARLPGWAAPCRCSNTCLRRSLGTNGRKIPVYESPMRSRSPTFWVMMPPPQYNRKAAFHSALFNYTPLVTSGGWQKYAAHIMKPTQTGITAINTILHYDIIGASKKFKTSRVTFLGLVL
jgi:hypothetical protein